MRDGELQRLKDLCEQATDLRNAADRLCKDLSKRITRSKQIVEGLTAGMSR